MEFWGVEVPSGKPLTCKPGSESYVHVSQAALGDNKNAKGNDRVVLKVKVGTNELVVGTLSQGKCDMTTLDLIFEKDFVLSHNGSGSVYFCGYKTDAVRDNDSMASSEEEDDEFDMSDEDEMEVPPVKENGKVGLKAGKVTVPAIKAAAKTPAPKPETSAGDTKPKAKPLVAGKSKDAKEKSGDDDEDDHDDEDDEEDEEDDSDEDDDMMGSGSDDEDLGSDDDDDSDSEPESEEEQPKSAGKKRPPPALQAASAGKKGKTETPGGKAEPKTPSAPVSTPKQQLSGKKDVSAKKTPGKENSNTPASGKKLGHFLCQPCSKNFNSESALSQHKTAKHK